MTADDQIWCELVLSGIGGRTIAEAKSNLTVDEFDTWVAYIELHGSLNIGRRLEYGFGLIAMLLNNAFFKGRREMKDFMPHHRPGPEAEISIDEAMRTWV